MVLEHIHSDDRLVEIGIGALSDVVVQVFFVAEDVHTLENELEEGLQVFRAGTRYENVRVPVGQSGGNSQSKGSRLAPTATSSEGHGRRKGLLGDSVDEGKNRLRLVNGLGEFNDISDGFGVSQVVLEVLKL